ncbi:MAG: DUF2254 domain-containing protein [Phycisphaerae bacterium]
MRTWFENKLDAIRANLWFLPTVMGICGALLAPVLMYLDGLMGQALPWLSGGSVAGVRSLLTALIGALVSAMSIVLSITVVALTLAASQLGPRILRNLIRDRRTQHTVGVMVAALLYCMTSLLVIGRLGGTERIPHLTVLGGFVAACVSLGALIHYVHRAALSMQAPYVIIQVSRELDRLIDRIYPEAEKRDPDTESAQLPADPEGDRKEVYRVLSGGNDYIQAIRLETLMSVATEWDFHVKLLRRPGHFTLKGEPLAAVYGYREPDEKAVKRLNDAVMTGRRRTTVQDLEFILLELVEIASRALSPGINDPQTACDCTRRLGAALCKIATRPEPPRLFRDAQQIPRVLVNRTSFEGLCNVSFNEIRHYAADSPSVLICLLEMLLEIAERAQTEAHRQAVLKHARMVQRACEKLPEPHDREDAARRFNAIRELLQPKPSLPAAE